MCLHTCLQLPVKTRETVRSLGAGVKDGFESPDVGSRN